MSHVTVSYICKNSISRVMHQAMAAFARLSSAFGVIMLSLILTTVVATAGRNSEPEIVMEQVTESYNRGDWEKCTELLHSYLRENDESDETLSKARNLAYAYLMLANVHLGYQDYLTAEKYYSKGLEIVEKWGLHEDELKFRSNLAATCCLLGNMGRAKEYCRSILKVRGVTESHARFSYLLSGALIQRKSGNWKRAVEMYKQSIVEIDSCRMWGKLKVTPYSELTEIYEEQGMTELALHYLEKYQSIAKEYNMQSMVVDAQRLAMRIYTRLGDPDRALYYQELYTHMQDSILNKSRFFDRVSKFEKETRDKDELRMQNMEVTISRQNLILLIIAVVLVVSLVFTGVIMRQKRRLHSSYRRLYEMNRRLLQTPVAGTAQPQPPTVGARELPEPANPDSDNNIPEAVAPERKALIKAIEDVMENGKEWCSTDFSLGRLAELTSSNTRYVSQAINETYGKNFRTYINEYRIREAMRRLSDSDNYAMMSIQGIGESVGFLSRSNFISAFKKQTGMTPSIYQKIAREEASSNNEDTADDA